MGTGGGHMEAMTKDLSVEDLQVQERGWKVFEDWIF